jgi:hypothetical protein
VVVFETHVERGNNYEGQQRKEAKIGTLPQKEAGRVLVGPLCPVLGLEYPLRSETCSILSSTFE